MRWCEYEMNVNARHYEEYENVMYCIKWNAMSMHAKNMKWDGMKTIVNARHWENMNCMEWNVMNMNAKDTKWNGNEANVNARHYEKYEMACAVCNECNECKECACVKCDMKW